MGGPEQVDCPLVNRKIENINCIENSDAVDGLIKKDTVPAEFKKNPRWEEICQNCKWHGY